MEKSNEQMSTIAIHGTKSPHALHAHLAPIYATSTYTFDSAEQGIRRFSGEEPGYTYSRFGNPTTAEAAEIIAALETFGIVDDKGLPLEAKALLHASGQSAMATIFLSNLTAGDTVLSCRAIYGGTFEFLHNFLQGFGVKVLFDDMNDKEAVKKIIESNPSVKLIHLETPANPTMRCVDIEAMCSIAKQHNIKVSIDNTFATPYLQQPFKYGVDFIFHSTTKFLNGHGTSIGGVLIGKDAAFMSGKAYQTCKLLGGNSNPFDAYLLMLGIKTLALRMEKHCDNAETVAHFLNNHPAIENVYYNGLTDHPDFEISSRQMRRHGAVLSFEIKGGFEKAKQFINRLGLCLRAVSLGTVDTLISHPASMSHSGMSKEERIAGGITDGLIRMSVGLEFIDDILKDLDQAL